MSKLLVASKKYFRKESSGANVVFSYWHGPSEGKSDDKGKVKDIRKKGGVGLMIALFGPEEFPAERASKFMWDQFMETYYDGGSDETQAHRQAVKATQKRLVELIKHEEVISEQGVDLHMCSLVAKDGMWYVSRIGDPDVILVRDGEIVNVSDMLPAYSGTGYRDDVTVGQFEAETGDVLMVSTPELLDSFMELFSDEDSEDDAEESVEKGAVDGDDEKKDLGESKKKLMDWKDCVREMDNFTENMTGKQYIWLVGHGVEDIEEVKPVPVVADDAKDKKDDKVKGEGYTPGGIKGVEDKEELEAEELKEGLKKDGEESLPETEESEEEKSKKSLSLKERIGGIRKSVKDGTWKKSLSEGVKKVPSKAKSAAQGVASKEAVTKNFRKVKSSITKMKVRPSPRQK